MKWRITVLFLIVMLVLTGEALNYQSDSFCSCYQERKLTLSSPLMAGQDVLELQQQLKELGFYEVELNSRYDWETYLAVLKFQSSQELEATGVVCEETWLKLGRNSNGDLLQSEVQKSAPEGEVWIVVNTYAHQLTVYNDREEYHTFSVAIGRPDSKTPIGEWRIIEKVDMWEGTPYGDKWMRLNALGGSYGIHGTNRPSSIGYASSNGCVRMFNQDVNLLYSWVEVGTKVKVIGSREAVELSYPIYPGETGMDVMLLQEKLRAYGFDPGDANRRFGEETKEAVDELKYLYSLNGDSFIDANVFYILGI